MNQGIILLALHIGAIILGAIAFWYIGARVFKIKESLEIQREILEELRRLRLFR